MSFAWVLFFILGLFIGRLRSEPRERGLSRQVPVPLAMARAKRDILARKQRL